MSQDPEPYNTPSHDSSPQNPYNPGSYGTPSSSQPPQSPYTPADPYASGNPPGGQPYGYTISPQPTALPLSEAIKQLPDQYKRVVTKPSAATFGPELPKASWESVWIQLLGLALVSMVINLFPAIVFPGIYGTTNSQNISPSVAAYLDIFRTTATIGGALAQLILVPLFFFIGAGIQYGLAKMFNGEGSFLAQSYASLLYQVPVGLASQLAGLLSFVPVVGPFIGGLISLGLSVYAVVLNVFQIQATHRLSGGKATAVVLIPLAVMLLLFGLCVAIAVSLFLSQSQYMPR